MYEARLSFEQRKTILKWYLKFENVVEVQRQWRGEYATLKQMVYPGPYLRTGPRGPGPGRQIFRGGILKKIEIEVWYAEKKGCPRERDLREIYTENNVGTEFSRYDTTGARSS